ncbi:adiponectin receptor protein 1 [Capsaspora owczarzaki ATCC 30864]|uniref:Adiponectin receptor protein 1 n=2 Tax=Capsaspora owczarzaki (strain ATCC 30864) TaxID=595528 RepID=A0A0D2WW72_CAPO3|nr:adiponectin receptor protein 1 [Capsaspora owczarzaki ATCC 30864]
MTATTSASVTAADEVLFTASASSTADLSKTALLSDPLLSREFIVAGGRWRTVSYHELPDWLKDNELILNHHRPQLFTFAQCIESIFRIHSETGNIWTHLVGWLAFLAVCVATFSYHLGDYPWEDHACFAAFFVGLLVCLSMSTTFHTVCCHSVNVAAVFSRFDYAGISMLIVGSTIPFLYYAFKCNTVVRYTYTGICVFLGTACIIISILPRFDTPRFRVHRMVTFLSFGVSGIVPGIHCIVVSGFMFQVEAAGIGYMLLMGALYITGAVLYAARIPERFFPGKCDLIFQSHQIFHVLVLAAASVHFYGLLRAAEYHHTHDTCVA